MAEDKDDVEEGPDIHFEPLVTLPPVETATLEEEEDEMIKIRAKLYRYDIEADPPEWKDRGVGDAKILKHKKHGTCRLLMRREKTLKVCANHAVLPHMELKPNCGSDKAWVWSTPADYADEEVKSELLAIRFANSDNAKKFKTQFDEAKKIMEAHMSKEALEDKEADSKAADEVAEKLENLTVKEEEKKNEECKEKEKEEKA
ncbi:hypothetical protein CAPTEDRAFT_180899 [Capitella teleta]|uniref:RanBD1 domain-containing protein n=1 Tax=Capitella teleta TaxID=283909 RepID=R7TWJ3_CAPTE|nr:hypothetical protein CAPTEDRAFT_180899 [Capitella teleta]|eukprot:ELT95335.1 hypothetical protein CAPTEDRAFT_180899 [Capitella teleta]